MSVSKISLNLCVSCEICYVACPQGAITMEYKCGQFLPRIDESKCNDCGFCMKVCPGISQNLKFRENTRFEEDLTGSFQKIYSACCQDQNIRRNSASGGVITQLIVKLLEAGEYAGAFVLQFDTFTGSPARLKLTKEIDVVLNAAKSKYIPASVYNVIKTLEKERRPNYIIVGTPCQILGIKKYVSYKNISCENLLFLGLFCDSTLNFNIVRYLEDGYSKRTEKLIKFDFKNKEVGGWPGHTKLYLDSNRKVIVHRNERIKVKKFFQLERCLYCSDKLNQLADISLGDCYIKWCQLPESSTVIVRTSKGKKVFDKYADLFNLIELNMEAVTNSQEISLKKKNLEFSKSMINENGFFLGGYSGQIEEKTKKDLLKLKKYVEFGQKYKIRKMKLSNLLFGAKFYFELFKDVIKIAAIFFSFFSNRGNTLKTRGGRKGKNVIIIGGDLSENMGAHAMTFVVVDQVKRRFPDKDVYLFSTSTFEKDASKKSLFAFKIMPWGFGTRLNLLSSFYPLKRERLSDVWITQLNYQDNLRAIIENAAFFIDVSGYSLFSNKFSSFLSFNICSYSYLLNIVVAKKFGIPFYVFPQSFGPFDYPLWEKLLLYPLMWKYLKYPTKIFAREHEGMTYLRKFTCKNVEKKSDLVLVAGEYDQCNIFNKQISSSVMTIPKNSVGIIPNMKLVKRVGSVKVFCVYDSLIKKLVDSGKRIFLLSHAQMDLSLCQEIKKRYCNEDNVQLITGDLNVLDVEQIISQFDFIIASRYHSIILAYKNGVPVLTMGWATKYFELMKDFNQIDYFFDFRKVIENDAIIKSLNKLIENHEFERVIIKSKIDQLEKNTAFNALNID
ncbi:MAG: polysaccharide pyruvyl transferase family protein [Candidatus Bathyarchaeota archaeon]|nr:polysaccharide pyruvyl transferase family protein [Candidatus Bathyarchaeota archaeon]